MSYNFDSRLGEQLYHLLPEVYRTRDKHTSPGAGSSGTGSSSEDLAKLLDAQGYLLDLIHETLKQQLEDVLPASSQDWLLPYFAELLAANIVSPDSDGKHAEIAHAVSWRQRKGTLKCAEEIAEAVGQVEVELQEGWKRVAMTPQIGKPIIPSQALDSEVTINMAVPTQATRHPSLPVSMVDLRRPSRAIEALPSNPAARVSNFGGVNQTWRQYHVHGTPCFPDSYEDVSRRTVDIRSRGSSINQVSNGDNVYGHYHHKRLIAYAPPPTGFFSLNTIKMKWGERTNSRYQHLIEEKEENGVLHIRNKTSRTIEITDDVILNLTKDYQVVGLNFTTRVLVNNGGRLTLHNVEVTEVQVDTFSSNDPVLTATDCLFDELSVGSGVARLDSCTILTKGFLSTVEAVNCIFMDVTGIEISGVIQYSRFPSNVSFSLESMTVEDCVNEIPDFFKNQTSLSARAVLSPNTPESIFRGAIDGLEMGYFHHGRKDKPVLIDGDFVAADALSFMVNSGYTLEDVIFSGEVEIDSGTFEIRRSAIKSLTVITSLAEIEDVIVEENSDTPFQLSPLQMIPSLTATDCLFDNVNVENGLVRFEYCTIMKSISCLHLQSSDSIFSGTINKIEPPVSSETLAHFLNCIRFSRVPDNLSLAVVQALGIKNNATNKLLGSNTNETPIFSKIDYCRNDVLHKATLFGEPGYGVLAPDTSDAVRFGAEDGGEMGAYHDKYYSLKMEATLDKMREFLPVGIEPVLIQDVRMLVVPPELIN